jgi:YegS/Rv2252/BmrU family lipid kinase
VDRHKIIVNPVSGRGSGGRAVPWLERTLGEYGLDYDLVLTERPWHAADLAREAVGDGYQVVVAAGGDGTANEVLNGLMLAKRDGIGDGAAFGLLCVGQGNDFAFGAGIPIDPKEGCRALADGARRTVDVGRLVGGPYPQGRYFGNGVGIGFDAVVSYEAAKMTRLHGFLSYMIAALKTIFLYYRAPQVRIEYDDQVLTQFSLMVSIMNGQRMGGGFMMTPGARPDDGILDLCIAEQISRPRIFLYILRFMRGTQAGHRPITMGRARRVVVTALEGVLPVHADGEVLCTDARDLTVEILPGQLELVRPA